MLWGKAWRRLGRAGESALDQAADWGGGVSGWRLGYGGAAVGWDRRGTKDRLVCFTRLRVGVCWVAGGFSRG